MSAERRGDFPIAPVVSRAGPRRLGERAQPSEAATIPMVPVTALYAAPTLRLGASRALRVGWALTAFFGVMSIALFYANRVLQLGYTWSLWQRMNVDAEATLPAWFSSTLIGGCAVVLLTIAALERQRGGRLARNWFALGVLFVLLSAEEIADFHTIPLFSREIVQQVSHTLGAPWLLLGIPFVLLFAAANLRFLYRLPSRTRNGFILAGVVYVGGAVVVEAIDVVHYLTVGDGLTMAVMVVIEECMEMAGMLLLLGTVLRYLREQFPVITLVIGSHLVVEQPAPRAVRQRIE